MRYITNASGYVTSVSFGADITCGGATCTEYIGSVPSGYASLEDWALLECEKLYRWKITSGNLTLVSSAVAPSVPTAGKVLWSHTGRFMTNTETATLSEAISAQLNGIILVWSFFNWSTNKVEDQYFNLMFVPKWYAQTIPGKGMAMLLTGTPMTTHYLAAKYLYISNTTITGYAGNDDGGINGSSSGTILNPDSFVLRYVIGV